MRTFVLGTTGTDVMRWLLHGYSCSLLSLFFLFFLVEYQTIILVHGGGGGGGGIKPGGISTVSITTFYPHHHHKSCLALLSSWARIEKNAILHSFLFCILFIISITSPSFLSSYESLRKSQILRTFFLIHFLLFLFFLYFSFVLVRLPLMLIYNIFVLC